jgi:F-type H+-transporting ATPase subunit delta
MKTLVLVKKYGSGLVNALKDDGEFSLVSQELNEFWVFFQTHKELSDLLASPFVPASKKDLIIKNVLAACSLAEKTSRFLLVLVDHSRLNLLPEILQVLPVLWQEKKGVSTFEVNSVVALTESQKGRLQKELERLEGRPVYLQYRIAPDLVAGLSLRKGNVVYDASIRGHLARIKEKICEG